jgi:hypothetical protein
MSSFKAARDGSVKATLTEPEAELLRTLPEELRAVYDPDNEGDPARARLFPRAYLDPTEEHAEEDWQSLVHPELLRDRLDALARIAALLDGAQVSRRGDVVLQLDPDAVTALLALLNDARLTLGTRLDVTEETEFAGLDSDDPRAPGLAAYAWLTYLEGDLIEALLSRMPESGTD